MGRSAVPAPARNLTRVVKSRQSLIEEVVPVANASESLTFSETVVLRWAAKAFLFGLLVGSAAAINALFIA